MERLEDTKGSLLSEKTPILEKESKRSKFKKIVAGFKEAVEANVKFDKVFQMDRRLYENKYDEKAGEEKGGEEKGGEEKGGEEKGGEEKGGEETGGEENGGEEKEGEEKGDDDIAPCNLYNCVLSVGRAVADILSPCPDAPP